MNTTLAIWVTIISTVVFGCQAASQGETSPRNGMVGNVAVAAPEGQADDEGPTVLLNYSGDSFRKNSIRSFMYFIPLVSPVPVGRQVCVENRQKAGIISYEKKVTARSFHVTCEFEMSGEGFCKFIFDPMGMIAERTTEAKKAKGETLTNVLDYINFEGEGYGVIRITGTRAAAVETVTEVEVEFNGKGRRSPVTIGLYELRCTGGQYCYENKSSDVVARVNSLAFKKSENPRMGITVASISRDGGGGLLGQIKAAVANLFIKPVRIDPVGNEAMLKFGYALAAQKPTFTFPKADNMKEIRILAAQVLGK
jgi:hypothetical protein